MTRSAASVRRACVSIPTFGILSCGVAIADMYMQRAEGLARIVRTAMRIHAWSVKFRRTFSISLYKVVTRVLVKQWAPNMVGVFLDECKTQITLLLFVYNTAKFPESVLVMAGFLEATRGCLVNLTQLNHKLDGWIRMVHGGTCNVWLQVCITLLHRAAVCRLHA